MLFDVTLRYNESIVRAAALASWRRAFGVRFLVAWLLVATLLTLLVSRGERSWFVGMLGTILVICALFAGGAYLVSLRTSLRKLRKVREPEARFQGQSSGFSITSELGTIGLPWGAVQDVWRYPDFWLLVLSRTSQLTIPLATIGVDTQSIILECVQRGRQA